MFSNGRKTIGILTENVVDEFSARLCRGVISEANQRGYNVACFSGFGNYGNNPEYFKGDCQIFELPPYELLDGIILLLDTIQDIPTRTRVLEHAKTRCQCPVISIREKIDGANNLMIDNRTCMEPIIRHFLDVHHFTNLCFMTGPADRWYSIERLNCFLRIMEEYHLPVDDHQIFYGDFWKNMGKPACDWFLEGDKFPQAIICANDHMASAVASELIKRGYEIPKEICVSGYDGLTDTLYFSPSLTTAGVPFLEMGVKAVQIIDEKQNRPSHNENYYFDVNTLIRESCGCLQIQDREVIASRRDWYEKIIVEENRQIQFNFLSIHLGECTSIDDIAIKIPHYIDNIKDYKDYCICLNKDLENQDTSTDYAPQMEVRIAIRDGCPMGPVKIPFDRHELLPAEVTSDAPQAWYFCPLHFESKTFGYDAIQFKTPDITANVYLSWSTNVSNALQDVLLHHKMQNLITELEYMYDRDALTGMYNRRGFEKWANELLADAKNNQIPFFLAIIDLDGMKQINDNYGHVEGDFALKKVRDAIWNSCEGTKTNARTGGDEFILFANGITEEEAIQQLTALEDFLDRFNNCKLKPYEIHASMGYMYQIPKKDDTLETFLKHSDAKMYENKIENKLRRNEPLR